MINEANEPSSACRSWRIPQVETSTPPKSFGKRIIVHEGALVKGRLDDEVALDWGLWKC